MGGFGRANGFGLTLPPLILSNPSHDTKESEEAGRMVNDCYEVGVDSKEPISDAWCLVAATMHYLPTT